MRFYPEGYSPEAMTVIGWNKHEYLEIEGPKVFVRVEMEAICKPADSKATDASTPVFEARGSQNCLPGCIAGNKAMATIVTDKWCHHLPEYRQVKRFEAMGLKLSTTSVNRWQHDLAGKLFPIYERQMELVFSSPYQHIDESTIPVNDQKHKTRKGYIWDTVDGMGRYGLAFFYEKGSRAGGVLKPKLLHRRAAVQSDGYRVYENIEQSQMDGITTLYCMAHARRRLEQIKDTSPEARKILGYIATLYELEANLKFAKADHDEIRRQRQEKAVPILGFIRLMLEKYKNVDTPQSALAKACNYALERWDGLCRYCEEGYYEIDNSAVERSIRPLTLGRRNWLFVDSDDSVSFTANRYIIKPILFYYDGNAPLMLGIRSTAKTQWAVWDNFQLQYLGKGNSTGIEKIVKSQVPNENGTIYDIEGRRVLHSFFRHKSIYVNRGRKYLINH